MIGDNPSTDIALANNCGIDSCLVLTGIVKNIEEMEEWRKKDKANESTYLLKSFG